ncbi:TRAP transporter substrate-binding protein DctP [Homoserinimonas sp. A447]
MSISRKQLLAPLALLSAAGLMLAGCSADNGGSGDDANGGETIELTLANSYTDDHPHNRCGATVIAERINGMDIGLQIEVFANSTLGGDADRFTSLMAGDIDIDMQGSSAIGSTYPPIGVLDAAYVFRGADHMFDYFASEQSDTLKEDLLEATGTRVIEPFFFGMRTFSANSAIRTPEDLEGLRMRFPDTPAYLQNAEALGANAVAVAFEEIFLALQQGIIDGQENPIPTVASMSLDEVQSHVSLNNHQTGFQLVLINEETWQGLNDEQQGALNEVIAEVRDENRVCIDEDQEAIIAEWEEAGTVEVVEDVDIEAFEEKAEEYFLEKFTGADLELYESIRASAPAA